MLSRKLKYSEPSRRKLTQLKATGQYHPYVYNFTEPISSLAIKGDQDVFVKVSML